MSEIATASSRRCTRPPLTIRRFEQRAIEQYRLGNIRGYLHPYLGEEAIAVGVDRRARARRLHRQHPPRPRPRHRQGPRPAPDDGRAVRQGDRLLPRPGRLDARRQPVGPQPGRQRRRRGRPRHRRSARRWPSSSGAGPRSWSRSAATARRPTAMWHESLNLAAIWDLPVIFVLENNQYAVSTPDPRQRPGRAPLGARRGLRHARASPWTATTRRSSTSAMQEPRPARARRRGPDAHRVHDLPPRRPPRQRPGALPARRTSWRAGRRATR